MIASNRVSTQHKIIAATTAIIVASFALFVAFPTANNSTKLETFLVYAGASDSITTKTVTRLSDIISLEAGAIIRQVSPGKDSSNSEDAERSQISELQISNAVLTIDQAPEIKPAQNASSQTPAPQSNTDTLITAVSKLGFETLKLDNAKIQLKRPGGAITRLGHLTTSVQRRDSGNGSQLELNGVFQRGTKNLDVSGQIESADAEGAANVVKLTLSNHILNLSLDGKLSTRNELRLTAEHAKLATEDLSSLMTWLGLMPMSHSGITDVIATGTLTWSGSTVAFDQARFTFDNNSATGRMSVNLDARKPSLDGTLAFDQLELGPYVSDEKFESENAAIRGLATTVHNVVLDGRLPIGLHNVDADIRVSAERLQLNGVEIGNGAAVLISRNGKLKADIAKLNLSNGIEGKTQIEIDSKSYVPAYVLRGNVDHVDLGNTSSFWFGKSVVDGEASLTFDLTAQGRTKNELLTTLTGPIMLSAQNGASVPFDLVKLFKNSKTTPKDGWAEIDNGFTALRNLSVEVVSSKGSLRTRAANANIDGKSLSASGTFKFRDMVMDLVLTRKEATDAEKNSDDKTKKSALSKEELQLKGPITEPIIRAIPSKKSRKG